MLGLTAMQRPLELVSTSLVRMLHIAADQCQYSTHNKRNLDQCGLSAAPGHFGHTVISAWFALIWQQFEKSDIRELIFPGESESQFYGNPSSSCLYPNSGVVGEIEVRQLVDLPNRACSRQLGHANLFSR